MGFMEEFCAVVCVGCSAFVGRWGFGFDVVLFFAVFYYFLVNVIF